MLVWVLISSIFVNGCTQEVLLFNLESPDEDDDDDDDDDDNDNISVDFDFLYVIYIWNLSCTHSQI